MMQSAGIVVNDVTVTWRNGHTALRDASFTVPSGSIAALVGVNGSGKSTLFKAIMGFVRLTSGKISVLGIPTRQALQKNLVAYVPQSEEVDWSFPVLVEDVVMMGRYRRDKTYLLTGYNIQGGINSRDQPGQGISSHN
ncbi:hypothetical protein PIENHEID_003667 [Escherichia coli]|nr:hypothetical protein [Escherichia coli]